MCAWLWLGSVQGHLFWGDVRYVVLDEADTMFDKGFGPEVRAVLGPLRSKANPAQVVLVVATLSQVRSAQVSPCLAPSPASGCPRTTPAQVVLVVATLSQASCFYMSPDLYASAHSSCTEAAGRCQVA